MHLQEVKRKKTFKKISFLLASWEGLFFLFSIFLWLEFACGFSARCGLEAWMHWSCIDVIVLGFKSVEELYRSPPLGVDSADNSQLPREKNLYGQFHPILPNNPARQ